MESGGKRRRAAGVVVAMAITTLLLLQLMAAPTAARQLQLLEDDDGTGTTPVSVLSLKTIARELLRKPTDDGYCAGETCFFGFCLLQGCYCSSYPYCGR